MSSPRISTLLLVLTFLLTRLPPTATHSLSCLPSSSSIEVPSDGELKVHCNVTVPKTQVCFWLLFSPWKIETKMSGDDWVRADMREICEDSYSCDDMDSSYIAVVLILTWLKHQKRSKQAQVHTNCYLVFLAYHLLATKCRQPSTRSNGWRIKRGWLPMRAPMTCAGAPNTSLLYSDSLFSNWCLYFYWLFQNCSSDFCVLNSIVNVAGSSPVFVHKVSP